MVAICQSMIYTDSRNCVLVTRENVRIGHICIVASALAVPVTRTMLGRSTGTGGAVTKTGPTGPSAIRPARTSPWVGPCLGSLFERRPAPNSR